MIIYVGKYPLKMQGSFVIKDIEEQMKINGITMLLPVFDNEDNAKKFCGQGGYLLMAQN